MNHVPLVSVVIPARNEAADLDACLAAITRQDHPMNHLEVIVVDGDSEDGTGDIARRALGRSGFGSHAVVSNPLRSTPSNLNAGLAKAHGEIVCRVDARTLIEPHYVRTCAQTLAAHPEIAVVGGGQVAIARDPTARAVGIARALNNRWSMGGSRYRSASASGASDTVYLGAFRRSDLEAVGGWDDRLEHEPGLRPQPAAGASTASSGSTTPSVRATCRGRRSARLWAQYRRFGRAKVRYWRLTGDRPKARQIAALVGLPLVVAAAAVVLWLDPRFAVAVVAGVFAVEHFGSTGPRGGLAARMVAAGAIGVVTVAWWSGVVGAWLRRDG